MSSLAFIPLHLNFRAAMCGWCVVDVRWCAVMCGFQALPSQTAQYLDSWLSDLLQSGLKMKLLEVEGAHAPVPHSLSPGFNWRLTWKSFFTVNGRSHVSSGTVCLACVPHLYTSRQWHWMLTVCSSMMPVSPGMLRKGLVSIAALAPHSMQTETIVSHHNIIVDDHRSCLTSETVNARLTVALNRVGRAHRGHDHDLRGHYSLKTNPTRVCTRPYCTALRQLTRPDVVQNDPRPAVVHLLTTKDRRLREP